MVMNFRTLQKRSLLVIQADAIIQPGTIWALDFGRDLFGLLHVIDAPRPAVYIVNHCSDVGLRHWRQTFLDNKKAWESMPTADSEVARLENALDNLSPIGATVIHAFAHRSLSGQWSPTPPQMAGNPTFGRGVTLQGGQFVSHCMNLAGVHRANSVACIGDAVFLAAVRRPSGLHLLKPDDIKLPVLA